MSVLTAMSRCRQSITLEILLWILYAFGHLGPGGCDMQPLGSLPFIAAFAIASSGVAGAAPSHADTLETPDADTAVIAAAAASPAVGATCDQSGGSNRSVCWTVPSDANYSQIELSTWGSGSKFQLWHPHSNSQDSQRIHR